MAANSHQFQNKRLISITDLQDCFTSRTAFDEWKRLVSHADARRCLYPPIYLATDAPAISNDERELQLSSLQTVYCIEISTDSTLPSWSVAEPLSNRVMQELPPATGKIHTCAARGAGCGHLDLSVPLTLHFHPPLSWEGGQCWLLGLLRRVIRAGGVSNMELYGR